MLDLENRKSQEAALRESQQVILAILNAVPARIFWKDKNLVYLGCNTSFARDAGFTRPEDIIGKNAAAEQRVAHNEHSRYEAPRDVRFSQRYLIDLDGLAK